MGDEGGIFQYISHIFVREIELEVQREEIEEYIRLQTGKSVPLLFIKGECIDGEKEIVDFHDSGKLKSLLSFVRANKEDVAKC